MPVLSRIKRIAIANRGEIARRIIRTCDRLGIETVALYSDVDADAPFVAEASRSVALGGPMSYLSVEAILSAARDSKADAIHPGYGFLSENPGLAQATVDSGMIFIGPSAATIRALGSKTNAKALAQRGKVPTAPTLLITESPGAVQIDAIRAFGASVGFPIIIKAAAGGGGRGMRVLQAGSDIATELASARRESERSFKSAEVFIEKYIAPARHIEVQIAADMSGHAVALGTRDCSLQRNNQKIIEEAPAVSLKDGISASICDAACRIAREAHYSNLGTVEFLYLSDGSFFFLEVNTRLQVEHPVTEMVTGLDLVELQIRIAQGETLAELGIEKSPEPRGHAIEARLCAEEFSGQFMTTTGVVLDLEVPTSHGTVRADMAVDACSVVSHHYDSLLGKIIAHGPSRDAAVKLLTATLARSRLSGVGNNRALLMHLLRSKSFRSLSHSVQETPNLLPSTAILEGEWIRAHIMASIYRIVLPRSVWASTSPWITPTDESLAGYPIPYTTRGYDLRISSRTRKLTEGFEVIITSPHPRTFQVALQSAELDAPLNHHIELLLNGDERINASLLRDGHTVWVHLASGTYQLNDEPCSPRPAQHDSELGGNRITSHIPGKISSIAVREGQRVNAGELLMVLDSMKMEHPVRAPISGTLVSVPVSIGTLVQSGTTLAVIKE